jgi:CRISPR-associated protein Csh1
MLKEIVKFADELEKNGIYDLLSSTTKQDYDIILVILKLINNQISTHRVIKVNNWLKKKYFLNLYKKYTRPLADDNNKALGGSQGLDTASHFSFRYQWSIPKQNKNSSNNNVYIDTLIEKWKKTFKHSNNKINEINDMLTYFEQKYVSNQKYEDMIQDVVNKANNKTPFIVFFWYDKYKPKDMEDLLSKDYQEYIVNKAFKKSTLILKGKKTCQICGKTGVIGLPNTFNNANNAIPFLRHLERKSDIHIAICSDCSVKIDTFKRFFLCKINTFPLFIESKLRNETIAFIRQNNEKLNFRDIMHDIYRKTTYNELDFYLIIYNRINDFIAFDYVTGFNFYKNGMSIFEIETLISRSFFDEMLLNNYFSDKVETKEKELDNLIYKHRSQIFDYIYRAKYNTLNKAHILDMYISSLKIKLRYLYNSDIKEKVIIDRINEMNRNFLKLDKYFGGNYMETIEDVKNTDEIASPQSCAYYAGQIVYYLLMQSEKKEKKHSMVEPFINISTLNTLGLKLIELFNAYSHAINITHKKFNDIFSNIFEFIIKGDNKKVKFDNNLKMFFYAGYFGNNIFFEKNEKIEEKGVSHGN